MDNIYYNFKPIDTIFILPLIKILEPILKKLKYNDINIGFFSLISYIISFYYIYNEKINLVCVFLYIAILTDLFDKINYNNNKINNKHFLYFYIYLSLVILLGNIYNEKNIYFILFVTITLIILYNKKN